MNRCLAWPLMLALALDEWQAQSKAENILLCAGLPGKAAFGVRELAHSGELGLPRPGAVLKCRGWAAARAGSRAVGKSHENHNL
jgi:hypothetical protein